MSNCSKHKRSILGLTNDQLAQMIGDMHYESLSDLLFKLSDKLENDSERDREGKRVKLALSLHEAALKIQEAWEISKPFMKPININDVTLGQLLSERFTGNITYIPADRLKKLEEDRSWPNSIPIVLFTRLLDDLEIGFETARIAINNTVKLLGDPEPGPYYYLWQNQEAVDKYLTRLQELMS